MEFSATLAWAMRLVCVIVVPASVALFALAGPLTVAIYHYGEFRAVDVEMTRLALMAFSFALLGWSLIKVLAPGYYARQDTKGPVRIAMRALGVTMGLNVIVVLTLAATGHLKSPGTHALLALTNGVGALMNAAMLYLGLRRTHVLHADRGIEAAPGADRSRQHCNGRRAVVVWRRCLRVDPGVDHAAPDLADCAGRGRCGRVFRSAHGARRASQALPGAIVRCSDLERSSGGGGALSPIMPGIRFDDGSTGPRWSSCGACIICVRGIGVACSRSAPSTASIWVIRR